jgi:hypothetical protein
VMQLILVGVVIAFPQSVTAFLDKPVVVDMEKAGQQLQQMEGGGAAATAPAAAATTAGEPAAAASAPEGSSDADPMKALEESMKKDAAGAKKP